MDPNGMFPGINSGENPLQQSQQNQNHPHTFHQMSPYSGITRQQMTNLSDDDDGGLAPDDVTSEDPTRKVSQWQRMKWTDTMVRLLIMAVYYIGDVEAGSDVGDNKRKPTGLLQKKGKWKSVSRAMMEKGFFVSPQQCEDKFNDLNKRYKRVNDILGKGTSCLVVENHNLLETMDLSPKLKDEVRKLLNSKHLFFREMCAYHTSCAHGGSSGCGPQQSPDVSQQNHHQQCSHSSEKILKEKDDEDDDDEDDESEESSDEEEEESGESLKKRRRKAETMRSEVMGVLEDGGRSTWEKKQWMKRRLIELEEEKLRYEMEAFELEKQKLKWVRFSSKKEREMEKAKLENERMKLENDRMVLVIRQKEIELLHQQQNSN